MEPLTPNTSAFLSMLAASIGDGNNTTTNNAPTNFDENAFNPFEMNGFGSFNNAPVSTGVSKHAPASLPPSAFFPIPGRDTPEDTPPSTNEASQSPEKNTTSDVQVKKSLSDVSGESDVEHLNGGRRASASHKRKAPKANQNNKHADDDLDDEDEDSDEGDEHEDKRVHGNAKNAGGQKKGGRKASEGGKETKAARRKEQNRAAQKAFRERREAKVKDLEDKVAELERKSYGTSVENENLRGILKRLQEENVALRQAAFTFSMPVNSAPRSGSGTGASTPLVSMPQRPQRKPLSPPSSTDDVLQSIHDVPAGLSRQSSKDVQSPDSLHSINSRHGSTSDTSGSLQSPPNLFQDPAGSFNSAALGGARPSLAPHGSASSNSTLATSPRSNSGISPASTSASGRTELDALWASFLQTGAPQKEQPQQWNLNAPNIMGSFNNQANGASFADSNAKVASATTDNWDKLAFRDGSAQQAAQPLAQPRQQPIQPPAGTQQADPWSGMMDNSMDDFLASLTGSNALGADNDTGVNDDDFNAQLQQIIGSYNASPSNAFALPGNPFSPTNYLNISPSPLGTTSGSDEPSPATHSGSSASASASPESILESHDSATSVSTKCTPEPQAKSDPERLYVVDDNGKIIKPSELWIKYGMQHESNLDHLLIDDLCDMMRAKATCQDGKAIIRASDAEGMFKYKTPDPAHAARLARLEQRAGVVPGAFTQPR